MLEEKKKFVIGEDVVKAVSETIQAYINHLDEDCARSGCMCDLRGEVCSQRVRNVLHDFDSQLCLLHSEGGKIQIGCGNARRKEFTERK